MLQTRFFRLTVPLLLALAACGPQVGEEEEEEEVRTFERRRPGCELFCGIVLDPECGAEERAYADVGECVDFCISEDATYWRLQEDDSDACAEEFVGLYECAADSSCDSRWIISNAPARISETPCRPGLEELFACQSEYPEDPE